MEVVPIEDCTKTMKHYIPPHWLLKPDKTTTNLRIGFDAPAETRKKNQSLNESLQRGPAILEDLCIILLRFRLPKVGPVADVEKAFLQVSLELDDRDVTRFLWLKDPSKPTHKTHQSPIWYDIRSISVGRNNQESSNQG